MQSMWKRNPVTVSLSMSCKELILLYIIYFFLIV